MKTESRGAAGLDGAQVELGVDLLDDLLAADVVEEDVGVRGRAGADLGQRAEQAGGGELPASSERTEKATSEWYWSAARA